MQKDLHRSISKVRIAIPTPPSASKKFQARHCLPLIEPDRVYSYRFVLILKLSEGSMDVRCSMLHNGQYGVIDSAKFWAMVQERAYCKAEKRGFAPGKEKEDWLEAEKEVGNQCRYWQMEFF
jgi:hypothetical protein